jgi:GDPmannose 4,6-dehydratase
VWRGKGIEETGVDARSPAKRVVRIDPVYFRPTEVDELIGDASKARQGARLEAEDVLCRTGQGDGGGRPCRLRRREVANGKNARLSLTARRVFVAGHKGNGRLRAAAPAGG